MSSRKDNITGFILAILISYIVLVLYLSFGMNNTKSVRSEVNATFWNKWKKL